MHGAIFEHHLGNRTERHGFTVHGPAHGGQVCKPVCQSVRRCQPAAFKAHAAQVQVGLHDIFQRRGNGAAFHRQKCLYTVPQKGLAAKARQCQCAVCTVRTGIGQRIGEAAGFRLIAGGKRIAHTRRKQPRRGFCDYGEVCHNHSRIGTQMQVPFKHTLGGIQYGEPAARAVHRSRRRRCNHRQTRIIRHRFCSIQRFTAAHADDAITFQLPQNRTVPVDFRQATFSLQRFDMVPGARFQETSGQQVRICFGRKAICQQIGRSTTQLHHITGQPAEPVFRLNIAGRGLNHSFHKPFAPDIYGFCPHGAGVSFQYSVFQKNLQASGGKSGARFFSNLMYGIMFESERRLRNG